MPNFWWCPTHHLYRGGADRPCADAVKLGDVEALRAEIRAMLDDWRDPDQVLEDIRAIVDREPAREGPCTCAGCQSVTEDTPKYYGSSDPGGSGTGGNAPEETSRG